MADRTVLFDELLSMPNVRSKSYVLQELAGQGLACIELQARRLEDWFFARRWVITRSGRRLLFWLLDDVEAHGFRFRVSNTPLLPTGEEEPWERASSQWGRLDPDERAIHAELFPEEERRLTEGYDWDDRRVFRNGAELARDAAGRILEEVNGIVHEWVRVPEEFTWRRFPLFAAMRPTTDAQAIRGT